MASEGAQQQQQPSIADAFGTSTWRPPSGLTDAQIKDKFRAFPVHPEPPHSCAVNATMAGVIGFPIGIFMALMFQSPELNSLDQRTDVSLMHKVKEGFKVSFRKGWSQGKSFATLGILFSSTECLMEKYRGKHDVWNSLLGGWIGGAAIAWRGGPAAIISSMALMTGFSLVLDLGLGMRGYRPSPLFNPE